MAHEICYLDWQENKDKAKEILTMDGRGKLPTSSEKGNSFFQFQYKAELLRTLTTRNSLFH